MSKEGNNSPDSQKIKELAELILSRWNPSEKALAAAFWEDKKGNKGFSPVCSNKFNRKYGCKLGQIKGACSDCQIKHYSPLTQEMVKKHLRSRSEKERYGIYPMLGGDLTAWVAVDLDDHTPDGKKDPVADLRRLAPVSQALDIPFFAFSSNSAKGFHLYIFFDVPTPAYKGRALMLGIIERADIDISHKKDKAGSFDCIFPKQDAVKNGIGNLISLPWNGHAIEQRRATLYLDPNTLEPYADNRNENIEYFNENFESLSEKDVSALLSEMGVKANPPPRKTPPPI